jgi:hypothetical protein
MIRLVKSVTAWKTPEFLKVLTEELESLEVTALPLQRTLLHSSYVVEKSLHVIVINVTEEADLVRAKIGIAYSGIIPGCSCEDDPTPSSEYPEYCELQLDINKVTAATAVTILS